MEPQVTVRRTAICCILIEAIFCSSQQLNAGQLSIVQDRTHAVTFGMSTREVERILPSECPKAKDMGWKPQGSVKSIDCNSIQMEFVFDKLDEIKYSKGYDLSIPLSPFPDNLYNIPLDVQRRLSWSSSVDEFASITGDWRQILIGKGLRFVAPTSPDRSWECPELQYRSFCISTSGDQITLRFGPTQRWVFNFIKSLVFNIVAVDSRYDVPRVMKLRE